MRDLFWFDAERGVAHTKSDFLEALNQASKVNRFICERNPFRQFVSLTLAMIEGVDVVLSDPSFSLSSDSQCEYSVNEKVSVDVSINSWHSLVSILREAAGADWNLGLFTSGSTGKPKQVWQKADALTQNVKTSSRFRNHRWALCYEPTHMAGLQVFFQAIMNGNMIAYLFESNTDTIRKAIQKYDLTHISATPTYYRLRVLALDSTCLSVQRITSGGEPFDASTMEQLREIFPEAQVRNVYALTEAGALLESASEHFEIPSHLSDSVRVDEDGELLLAESLVQDADQEDLTKNGWFKTGDIVEVRDDGSIKFIGRSSDEVTVAGYQVHLREVEQEILSASKHVVEASVGARESSVTGKILTADLATTPESNDASVIERVRANLSSRLPSHKVPRKYNISNISLTRTGKKRRKK